MYIKVLSDECRDVPFNIDTGCDKYICERNEWYTLTDINYALEIAL